MRTITALIQREYLEHRGAFLYAPGIILALLTIVLAAATSFDRIPGRIINFGGATKLFEVAFLGMAAMWLVYLLAALFFYFADAFNADRRNNAMLFWKSMPVSDFTVLGTKMLAGATIFPALVLVAAAINSLLVLIFGYVAVLRMGFLGTPDLLTVLGVAGQVALFAIPAMLLTLLWYAPFFAWVGMLSTLVGRWSIPLAFLIPGVIGLFEKLILRFEGPDGGYFLGWLSTRMDMVGGRTVIEPELLREGGFNGLSALSNLVAQIEWTQMAAGLAVAVIFVALAAEYRRRFTIA
jgi:ABC-2 type transport system permease protein